ncbi:MAG: hypothetical protein HKN20_11315 [Gemmatimonadetes bacterium]|nr:hypothetical protein [Gemmatimonadota bacterium]
MPLNKQFHRNTRAGRRRRRARISLLLVLSMLFPNAGCNEIYRAPKNWFDPIDEEAAHAYGSWAVVVVPPAEGERRKRKTWGEIIAVEPDTLFLLDGANLQRIPRSEVIELWGLRHGQYYSGGLHAFGNFVISPLLIGLWAVPGVIVHAIAGFGSSGDYAGRQTQDYPDRVRWTELAKGARFPAGIPPTLDRDRIRQKKDYEYSLERGFGVWE